MRIASLSPAITEILFAIGCGTDIVCRDQFSNYPDDTASIPAVRDHQAIDPQAVAAFAPEVIFTSTVVQAQLAAQMRAQQLPVLHDDPRTLDQVYQSIRAVGAVVGRVQQAEALVLSMQQGMHAVRSKAKHLPRRLHVYVEEWHQPPMASGNWVPDIVRAAGGEPFPIRSGELSRAVSLDEVATFAPALVVISWCGAGALADRTLLLERAGWQRLAAVADRRVRVIDDSLLNRPGPRLVDGAQRLYGWLFELLH